MQRTLEYPQTMPLLKSASLIFLAAFSFASWLWNSGSVSRCLNNPPTSSGRLDALNATAATMYHGFRGAIGVLVSAQSVYESRVLKEIGFLGY